MWMALLGAMLCLAIMFVIDWITALVTFCIVFALYVYVHHRKPGGNWLMTDSFGTIQPNYWNITTFLVIVPWWFFTYTPSFWYHLKISIPLMTHTLKTIEIWFYPLNAHLSILNWNIKNQVALKFTVPEFHIRLLFAFLFSVSVYFYLLNCIYAMKLT